MAKFLKKDLVIPAGTEFEDTFGCEKVVAMIPSAAGFLKIGLNPHTERMFTDTPIDSMHSIKKTEGSEKPECPPSTETIEIFEPSGKRWATFSNLDNVRMAYAPGVISFEGTDVDTGTRFDCQTSLQFLVSKVV